MDDSTRAGLESKGIKAATSFQVATGSYRIREVIREAVQNRLHASTLTSGSALVAAQRRHRVDARTRATGMNPAAKVAESSAPAAIANANGSVGFTSNNMLFAKRDRSVAANPPTTHPGIKSVTTSRSTSPTIFARGAQREAHADLVQMRRET